MFRALKPSIQSSPSSSLQPSSGCYFCVLRFAALSPFSSTASADDPTAVQVFFRRFTGIKIFLLFTTRTHFKLRKLIGAIQFNYFSAVFQLARHCHTPQIPNKHNFHSYPAEEGSEISVRLRKYTRRFRTFSFSGCLPGT